MVRSRAEPGWNPAGPHAWGPYAWGFVNWFVRQEEVMQIQCGCIFIEDIYSAIHFLSLTARRTAESVDEPPRSQSAILASVAHGGVKAGCAAAVYDLNVSERREQARTAVGRAALGSKRCFPRTLMFSPPLLCPVGSLPTPPSHTLTQPLLLQLPRCCSCSVSQESHSWGLLGTWNELRA